MTQNPTKAVIHPLVLLSISDHFERAGKPSNKRVAGTLLGSTDRNGVVEVTNCFAVPFEEDKKDESVWFLDHAYHEKMSKLSSKVNAKEKVVGWYSSGPALRRIDIEVSALYRKYCKSPVLLVMDARENASVDPKTYFVDTELEESEPRESLAPLETVMAATEPEEIGVEHLLRDVRDKTAPTLAKKVQSRDEAKSDFAGKLEAITDYLRQVETGEMPRNEKICALVRDLFNDAVNSEKDQSFVDAYAENGNDSSIVLYVATLAKMVAALADLDENRSKNRAKAMEQKSEKKGQVETESEEIDDEQLAEELMMEDDELD